MDSHSWYGLMLNVPSCLESHAHTLTRTQRRRGGNTWTESGMTRHDDPESKSAGKKPPLAAVTLGLDHRNSCVLPKRTPWAGAMYLQKCYTFELGDKVLHI